MRLLLLLLVALLGAPHCAAYFPRGTTFSGMYRCTQGMTGSIIRVLDYPNGEFDYFGVNANCGGTWYVTFTLNNSTNVLRAEGKAIKSQQSGCNYVSISFNGTWNAGTQVFSGLVQHSGCSDFRVTTKSCETQSNSLPSGTTAAQSPGAVFATKTYSAAECCAVCVGNPAADCDGFSLNGAGRCSLYSQYGTVGASNGQTFGTNPLVVVAPTPSPTPSPTPVPPTPSPTPSPTPKPTPNPTPSPTPTPTPGPTPSPTPSPTPIPTPSPTPNPPGPAPMPSPTTTSTGATNAPTTAPTTTTTSIVPSTPAGASDSSTTSTTVSAESSADGSSPGSELGSNASESLTSSDSIGMDTNSTIPVISGDGGPTAQREEDDPWEWWIYLLIALTVLLCLVVVIGAIVCVVNRNKNKNSTAPPREMFRQTSASAHLENSNYSTTELSPGTPRTDRVAIYSSMPEMPPSGSTFVGTRSEYADAESIRQIGIHHQQSNASIDYGIFGGGVESKPVVYDRGF